MIDFKGHRFEKDLILLCVRWYLAYPLSYRNLEEMMAARGVEVDHLNSYRWVQKFTPLLEATFRKGKKRPVGNRWRMDETHIKVKGQWRYLYRAVDKAGQTLDFLLTADRDKKAARRFLKKAIRQHGLPGNVMIDNSGANTAALEALPEETGQAIAIRQSKSVNHRIEQDHRSVKRIVRPLLGFKALPSAQVTLQGIELMPMIKKCQMITGGGMKLSAVAQFYSLAAQRRLMVASLRASKINATQPNGAVWEVRFSRQDWAPCPHQASGTHAKKEPRLLGLQAREPHEALPAARARQITTAFRQ